MNQFKKHGYDRSLIEQQIDKANLQEREQLLKEKRKRLPQISLYCTMLIQQQNLL